MLSRLLRPASRHLVVSSIYAGVFALGVTNLVVNGPSYHPIELGLTIAGVALWGAATVHGMVRRIRACCNDRPDEEETDQDKKLDNDPALTLCSRNSTHTVINGSLHVAASSIFAIDDILALTRVIPATPASLTDAQLAIRLSGTGLWWLTANLTVTTALAISRRQESHPKEDVTMCGISGETYNLAGEIMYISAGVLYAYVIYTYQPVNIYKAVNDSLWLFAGVLGTADAAYTLHTKRSKSQVEVIGAALPRVSDARDSMFARSSEPVVVISPGAFTDASKQTSANSSEESERTSEPVIIIAPGIY